MNCDLLDQLWGPKLFSVVELMQGYYQIRIKSEDYEAMEFRMLGGLYEFKVPSFGLVNAPAMFQMPMSKVLFWKIRKSVLVYLDDILIYSKMPKDHVQHLREVF